MATWTASSLVGVSMRAVVELMRLLRWTSCSRMGRAKAAVLPDPAKWSLSGQLSEAYGSSPSIAIRLIALISRPDCLSIKVK